MEPPGREEQPLMTVKMIDRLFHAAEAKREKMLRPGPDSGVVRPSSGLRFSGVALTLATGTHLRREGEHINDAKLPPLVKATLAAEESPARRRRRKYIPPPVIQNQKALELPSFAKQQAMLKVRDFYAVSVRGQNPNESHIHMQARIGFCGSARRQASNVRLRPLQLERPHGCSTQEALGEAPLKDIDKTLKLGLPLPSDTAAPVGKEMQEDELLKATVTCVIREALAKAARQQATS
eukprot:TRINITY_DN16323_c0_g1_i1.p1 TRINITY_DN16323_c0_g1~~TRINITY_DN16323_c0_g1_i1.p1  ORF type:complete len:263 (-),score=57.08 TRINITY_DN16323_c0_g1_i1:396-1106(-)